jgi:tRNA 2-thiouridine synthesizing protein A
MIKMLVAREAIYGGGGIMSSDERAQDLKADKSIDCSGKRCPMPIYMASRALKSMQAGELLEVKCTDANSANDFPGFAEKKGHVLAATRQEGKVYLFYLRKGDG